MSGRQLRWVAAALVVAALLWLVSARMTGPADDRVAERVLPANVEGVDRIVFTSQGGSVELTRGGRDWMVNGHKIKNTHLATLFTALRDSTPSEIAARSPGVHARMGVDGSARSVAFYRGSELVSTVLFGNQGSDQSVMYTRKADEDVVYRYRGQLTRLVVFSEDDWRDKTLVSAPAESIARVAVDRGGSEYALTREGSGWTLTSGAPVDTAKMSALLSRFFPLEAGGIASAAQRDSADFNAPVRRLTLFDDEGNTIVALRYDSLGPNDFLVRNSRDETVYLVPSYTLDQLMPDEEHYHLNGD